MNAENVRIEEGMSDAEYFAMEDHLNASTGKKMDNPEVYAFEKANPKKSDALDFGALFHDYILRDIEPKHREGIAVAEWENFKTKKAQAWRDENEANGKMVFRKGELAPLTAQIESMADAIYTLPEYTAHLNHPDTKKEVVILWERRTTSGMMIKCKAKLDSFNQSSGIVYDLKSTKAIESFNKDCANLSYYVSMAWYREAARAAGAPVSQAKFAVAGKSEPYQSVLREVPGYALDHGLAKMEVYAENWRQYSQSDVWPCGYSRDSEMIDFPYWWKKQEGINLG